MFVSTTKGYMQQVDFAILRSEWMVSESSAHSLMLAAKEHLAGRSLSVGFFSKLPLPDVPSDVALIAINGVMTKADICGGMGTRSLANAVMAAANDSTKASIILFFESVPGGQVDGTQEFGDAISLAKEIKPVVAVISGMCASAGVWAASQCTEIYTMAQTDQVGCIGVLARISKKDDNADSDYELIYSDLSPDKNAESRDPQVLKDNYLNPTAKLFQQAVMKGRGDRLKADAKGVLSGTTFIAKAAKANGLIEGTMSFEKILQRTNYLSKTHNSNTMSAKKKPGEGAHVFQALLAIAGAEAFAPIEEGFAMTEEQMTTADAGIVALQASNKRLTDAATAHATQLQVANDATTEANTALTAANAKIIELEGTIVTLGKKPAAVKPNPSLNSDPTLDDPEEFMTSTDRELAARKAKVNIK